MRRRVPPLLSRNAPTLVLLSLASLDRQTSQSHPTCGIPKLVPVPRKVSFRVKVRTRSQRLYAESSKGDHRQGISGRVSDYPEAGGANRGIWSLIRADLRAVYVKRDRVAADVGSQSVVAVSRRGIDHGKLLPWNEFLPLTHPIPGQLEAAAL